MQKKLTLWYTLLLSVFIVLVSACGSNTPLNTSSAPRTATVSPGESIYVLDGYTPLGSTNTAQQIVAFHPDGSHPKTVVSLPAGLTSLDHKRLYTAIAQSGKTTLRVVDTQSGATIRSLVIDGAYTTSGQNFNDAVLTIEVHCLSLRDVVRSIVVKMGLPIRTQRGKLVDKISLTA